MSADKLRLYRCFSPRKRFSTFFSNVYRQGIKKLPFFGLALSNDPRQNMRRMDLQKKLDRLARHKARIERTFHSSLKELEALHTNTVILTTLFHR